MGQRVLAMLFSRRVRRIHSAEEWFGTISFSLSHGSRQGSPGAAGVYAAVFQSAKKSRALWVRYLFLCQIAVIFRCRVIPCTVNRAISSLCTYSSASR